jgi:hypothetical protein
LQYCVGSHEMNDEMIHYQLIRGRNSFQIYDCVYALKNALYIYCKSICSGAVQSPSICDSIMTVLFNIKLLEFYQ